MRAKTIRQVISNIHGVKKFFFILCCIKENFLMAPLAPTVGHFPGFRFRKKFPHKWSTFFFGGYPRRGGGMKKFSAAFFPTGPLDEEIEDWEMLL